MAPSPTDQPPGTLFAPRKPMPGRQAPPVPGRDVHPRVARRLRGLTAMLGAVAVLTGACRKNEGEPPEPAGQLEGTWRVGQTEPVAYDRQDNVVRKFDPVDDVMGYTQLTFTGADVEEYHARTLARTLIPYVRTGDQLTCPPPYRSYTIRKLTTKSLDLYLRGEYMTVNTSTFRYDYLVHLSR